ncbi:MAG: AraC family transcriptional regulator [Leptolinea sp.]|jgi:AraC-like DNA-binding protein|nr:AraC family transcriptional regulator [Leptolinea sp.]
MLSSSPVSNIKLEFSRDEPLIGFLHGTNVCHTFPLHIHHSYILGILTGGKRIIHVDDRYVNLAAPDCFIIHPFQPHSCQKPDREGHDYRVVSIPSRVMREANFSATGRYELPAFPTMRIEDQAIACRLLEFIEIQEGRKNRVRPVLHGLLIDVIQRYANPEPLNLPDLSTSSYIGQVCKYLEKNAGQSIALNELSRQVNINQFHLNRSFRERVGIPPHAYLIQTRIRQSLQLLIQGESICEVAYRLGFSDQSHFTRIFKEYVGISPGRFLGMNRT